jgi:hypothetical protein
MREMRNAYRILKGKFLREKYTRFRWFKWEYSITNKTYLKEVTYE